MLLCFRDEFFFGGPLIIFSGCYVLGTNRAGGRRKNGNNFWLSCYSRPISSLNLCLQEARQNISIIAASQWEAPRGYPGILFLTIERINISFSGNRLKSMIQYIRSCDIVFVANKPEEVHVVSLEAAAADVSRASPSKTPRSRHREYLRIFGHLTRVTENGNGVMYQLPLCRLVLGVS